MEVQQSFFQFPALSEIAILQCGQKSAAGMSGHIVSSPSCQRPPLMWVQHFG